MRFFLYECFGAFFQQLPRSDLSKHNYGGDFFLFFLHFSKHFRTCFDYEMIHLSHRKPPIKSHHTFSSLHPYKASPLRPLEAGLVSHLSRWSLPRLLAVSATSLALFRILPVFFFFLFFCGGGGGVEPFGESYRLFVLFCLCFVCLLLIFYVRAGPRSAGRPAQL